MDLFPDGAHVQLRSRFRGRFLSADADWLGVSVTARPLLRVAFLRTVWRIRHHKRNGDAFLILQGTAYGRYLASSPHPPQSGDRGRAAVQGYFDDSNVVEAVLWRPLRARNDDDIILSQFGGYKLRSSRGEAVSVAPCFSDEDFLMTRWCVVPVESGLGLALPPRTLPPGTAAAGMGVFSDGDFLRLECLTGAGDSYLHAHSNSLKVSVRPPGRAPFASTVWRVHIWHRERGVCFLMLQGAANGKYLGAVTVKEEICRASQCLYDDEDARDLLWEPTSFVGGLPPRVVSILRNARHGPLRTSGRVTRWKVRFLNASSTPPALPPTVSTDNGGSGFGRAFTMLQRTIRFVRADSEGNYPNRWREFRFEGCCITSLRTRLAEVLIVAEEEIVLCVHSGSFGRLIPLVVNLPRSKERMDIVVLDKISPAAARLSYPMEEEAPTPDRKVLRI